MAEPVYTQEQIRFAVKELEAETGEKIVPDQETAEPVYSREDILKAQKQLEENPPRTDDLSAIERMAATRAKDEPDRLERILSKRGFLTERKGDEVLIVKEDGSKVPWDPEGWDLGDIADLVPEAFEVGVSIAAGASKVAGAISAPVTGPGGLLAASALSGVAGAGLETGMQAVEKGLGFRKEFDEGTIGRKGLAAATVPGAGKLVEKAGKKIIGTFGQKAAAKKAAEAIPGKPVREAPAGFFGADVNKNLRAEAEKALGKKSAVDGVIIATDVFRTLKGDPTPVIRRLVWAKIKEMAPNKVKALGSFLKKGTVKTAAGLGKAAGIGSQATARRQMDELVKSIQQEAVQ